MDDADPPRYVIEDAAGVELQEAAFWYHAQQRGLGNELLAEFEHSSRRPNYWRDRI